MGRSSLFSIGDLVRYIGPAGVYMCMVDIRHGDTGVVTQLGKPTIHNETMIWVRLFNHPEHDLILPDSFFLPM